MTLVSPELKEGIKQLFDSMKARDETKQPFAPTEASAKMTGAQASEVTWPQFTLASDEPKSVGGTDKAPTPVSIFVASIAFAENVIFARHAAMRNIDFDSMETKVAASWNRKGMFGIRGADPSVTDVLIETRISSKAKPQDIAELVRLNNSRCPLTTTVAKAAEVSRRLYVNGESKSI